MKDILRKGNHSAREICHAQVLLHSNDAKPDQKKDNRELAAWLGISPTTVNTIRKTYAQEGLDAALQILRALQSIKSPILPSHSLLLPKIFNRSSHIQLYNLLIPSALAIRHDSTISLL